MIYRAYAHDFSAAIPKCTTHVFWKAVEGGAREGAKEAGAEMIWKGSLKEDDPAQQIRIVEQFVAEDVGGIVLAPIDDAALEASSRRCHAKGNPGGDYGYGVQG